VAADESTIEDIANFATQMGVIYPVLIGNKPSANLYGGDYVLPTTYFIDRGLASSWSGGLGWLSAASSRLWARPVWSKSNFELVRLLGYS